MRILHVLDHSIPLQSGYSFRTRSILEQQRRLGWETVHLTGPKQGETAVLAESVDGFEFHRTPASGGWPNDWPILGHWALVKAMERRLLEVARAQQPDVLHAHSPVLDALAALAVGRRLGLPVVYEVRAFWEDAAVDHGTATEGGLRYRATRALETHALRKADAVTTICEGLRREILARGIAEERVTVIPNAVDAGRFAMDRPPDAALAARLGLTGKRVLGFIGSFYAYEGLDLLLDALPRIRAALPEVCLLLVGGGPQDQALRARAAALGLGGAVIFTGRVAHGEVQRYYDLVEAFVYPRKPMRLTEIVTPLKPLEAMAQGKLVVASDVGGHRELVRDGATGQLFRAGDASALAEAVRALFAGEARWPERRAAARRFVEQERSWPASVARYRGVYSRLIGVAAPATREPA